MLHSAFFLTELLVTNSINSKYSIFLTTLLPTTLFNLLKSAKVVSPLPISNLSTSDFKLSKSSFDILTPVAFFKSGFVA